MEKQVKVDLLRYVERLRVVQDSILNFAQDRQPYDNLTSPSALSDYLKHPVHAFQLIKRMTAGLKTVEAQIERMLKFDPLINIKAMRKQRLLPWDDDFQGLATSLVTLQDIYALDFHELTEGHLHTKIPRNRTIPGRLPLNARDCLNISQVALRQGMHDLAVKWAEQAVAKAADEEPPSIPKQELDSHYEAVVTKTHEVPVQDCTKQSADSKAQLFQEVLSEDQEDQNYKRLCRGEVLRSPKMDSQLRCRYYKGQDGSFALQPIKLEEINLKPYVIVMHDVVQDKDIEDLMAFAEPRLERSTTYTGNEMMPSPERTSSTAWLNEDEAPIAVRMNSYLRALLGMGTSDTNEEAEAYQLANYGTGGHFLPHHDFLQDSLQADNSSADYYLQRGAGDRLATLMIYMTDVEEGGATVFPNLGIRLTPKKGDAAFWWNLKASGDGERLTTHAGCPVLYGSKWIANKWFRSYSNVFRLPCSTDRNASLAPLV
ncbi:prolyl 4-hydroxylase subunit alpha-1-like [Ixodes scapularis]